MPTHIACSGVKHLEEIRQAGLELPDINQIEVSGGGGFAEHHRELRESLCSFNL